MTASSITLDMHDLLSDKKGALLVSNVADYTGAYVALRNAILGGSPVSLLVRDRTVADWFSAAAHAYGDGYIKIIAYTPREALAERWGVVMPSDVSDHDILASDLLEIRVTPKQGQHFWDALLDHFYGDAFTYKVFPVGDLSSLLNKYTGVDATIASDNRLLLRAVRSRLEQWENKASNEAVRTLVRRLRSDPKALRHDLTCYKVLRDYPDVLGMKVLGQDVEVFRKAQVEIGELTLTEENLAKVLPYVEYYLGDVSNKVTGIEDVEQLLREVSGYLLQEFNAIEALLKKHPEWITGDLLRHVEQRFRPIRDRLRTPLAGLRRLVVPGFPATPTMEWDVRDWLDWVRDSYMPYYSWLDIQGKRDEKVANYASAFADWYYEHFIELKNGMSEHFAFSTLYEDRERMLAEDAITLVLIADNFNLVHFDELCRLFNQQGFSLQAARPVLSLVPTATEVSKAGIIAGRGDQVDLQNANYADLVMKEWNPLLHGKSAGYMANIGELQQLRELTHKVYFLNYLRIDKILHEDNRETGRPHADQVYEALASLTAEVADFSKRFQLDNRLVVYVISDHGSTRISQKVVNILDSKFFKGIALDSHHRFIALSDERLADLPQVADAQCYRIDKHRFKTNQSYLAAREYYRFRATEENFYVHGGLTPEEVVVPFARFEQVLTTPISPTVQLPNKEYRYAIPSKVLIEIGNPNNSPLDTLSVRLVDAVGEEMSIDKLGAKQAIRVEILTKFQKQVGAGNTRSLTVRVQFECQGRTFGPDDYKFEITMKALMEVADDGIDL